VAVLGKDIWGSGPSSLGRQQRLSEITRERIKNVEAWARFGGLCPLGPNIELPLDSSVPEYVFYVFFQISAKHEIFTFL